MTQRMERGSIVAYAGDLWLVWDHDPQRLGAIRMLLGETVGHVGQHSLKRSGCRFVKRADASLIERVRSTISFLNERGVRFQVGDGGEGPRKEVLDVTAQGKGYSIAHASADGSSQGGRWTLRAPGA